MWYKVFSIQLFLVFLFLMQHKMNFAFIPGMHEIEIERQYIGWTKKSLKLASFGEIVIPGRLNRGH